MKLKCSLPLWIIKLAFAALLAGCGKHSGAPNQAPPSVTVSRPSQERIADSIETTGTLAPSKSVDLVARVTGYLQSVNFEDGSFVDAGKLLFVIEPDSYEQDLALAKAALVQAQAEYDRQNVLIKDNATSTANVEKWRSQYDQARAQVEQAKLNLGYTRVTAPFNGRIGRRLVDEGNLVSPTANSKLATLEQLVPIYAYFSLNEREALRLWELIRQRGRNRREAMAETVVQVGLQNEEGYPHTGRLDFVDSGVSTSSGAIPMRAVLQNEDRVLFPGLFGRIRIPYGEPRTMPVVPKSAIGSDQEGDYVLVVDANDVVVRRSVVKGPATGSGCAITSGLTVDDRIIIAGQMQAKPGSRVTPVDGKNRVPGPVEPTR